MLEKLVHGNGIMPPNQHYQQITIPKGTSYEVVTKDRLPGWDQENQNVSRSYGEVWARERRSLILVVPSFVARIEMNLVVNPLHNEFHLLEPSELAVPIWWDDRLFASRSR